jgi:geranylgeranyl pyrophosphate synthase
LAPAISTSDAATFLLQARAATNAALSAWHPVVRRQYPGAVGQAMVYALEGPGKRLRPALTLAAFGAAAHRPEDAAELAAAVEVVHTYSLVHDDLPCMDDDAQRRGRPTLHVRFDVPTATRAGYLLVPVAVQELVGGLGELGLAPGLIGRMADRMLEASGLRGMVAGQWIDLMAEGSPLSREGLAEMHRRKTGALIEAACVMGAISAGASDQVVAVLSGYGREVGMAFQIADDLLDATATTEELGKTAGRDATLAKATYVSLLGIEASRDAAHQHGAAARRILHEGGVRSPALDTLAGYIVERRS